jgi:hypothetical protein
MWSIRFRTSPDIPCSNSTNALPKLSCPFFKPRMSLQGLKSTNIHASYNPPSSYLSDNGGHPPKNSGTISLWLFRIICPLPSLWERSCTCHHHNIKSSRLVKSILYFKGEGLMHIILKIRQRIKRLLTQRNKLMAAWNTHVEITLLNRVMETLIPKNSTIVCLNIIIGR